MKKFFAKLFVDRFSLESSMALAALSVLGLFFPFGGGCGKSYLGNILCEILWIPLSIAGLLLMPFVICNHAARSWGDKPAETVGAIGCAVVTFIIGCFSLAFVYLGLRHLWGK